MRVEITAMNGDRYQLDTPDASLIGVWLKAWFDKWNGPRPRIPTTFTITIS